MAYTLDQLMSAKRNQTKKPFEGLKPVTLDTKGVSEPYQAMGAPTTTAEQQGGGASSGASKFINFDRLMSANKPGAESMANKALGAAFERGTQAEKSTQKAEQEFGQKVKSGTNVYTGGGWGTSGDNMGAGNIGQTGNEQFEAWKLLQTGGPAEFGGSGVDPNTGLPSLATIQAQAAGGYTGPEESEFFSSDAYQQAQKDVLKGQQAARAMGDQPGLEAFMNELYGTAGGTGGSRLDAALARVAGGPAFQRTQERFKNLNNLLEQAGGRAQKAVRTAKDESTTAATMAQQDIDALNALIARVTAPPPKLTKAQQILVDQGASPEDVKGGVQIVAESAGSPNQGEYNEWYDYVNPLKWFGVI